jgi:hypothetical protein
MTKEEIYNIIFKDVDKCFHFPELKNMVELVAEEYAEQQSIAFVEFLLENYMMGTLDGDANYSYFNKDGEYFTTKELYQLFLSQNSKQ